MKPVGMGRKLLFGAFTLIVLALGCLVVLPVVIHNCQLWRSGGSVDSLSHPPGTSRVTMYSQVGLLFGNGNHTDFWIKEIRSFKGNFLQIKKHYDNQKVVFPDGITRVPDVSLLRDDPGDVPYEIAKSREWKDFLLASDSLYSITVYYQTGPEGDLRSH